MHHEKGHEVLKVFNHINCGRAHVSSWQGGEANERRRESYALRGGVTPLPGPCPCTILFGRPYVVSLFGWRFGGRFVSLSCSMCISCLHCHDDRLRPIKQMFLSVFGTTPSHTVLAKCHGLKSLHIMCRPHLRHHPNISPFVARRKTALRS